MTTGSWSVGRVVQRTWSIAPPYRREPRSARSDDHPRMLRRLTAVLALTARRRWWRWPRPPGPTSSSSPSEAVAGSHRDADVQLPPRQGRRRHHRRWRCSCPRAPRSCEVPAMDGLDVRQSTTPSAPCPGRAARCRRRRGRVPRRRRAADDARRGAVPDDPGDRRRASWRGSARRRARARSDHPAPRLTLVADPNATTTTSEATTTTTEATTTTDEPTCPARRWRPSSEDDGNTSAAPWIIGSGIAALVAIAVGGTILKRRAELTGSASGRRSSERASADAGGRRRRRWRPADRRGGLALEPAREALDEPVLASSGLEHGLCVGEGSVVAQRSHERGERVHGVTVAPRCDLRDTAR